MLQNMPEGEGAEARNEFSEHYERKSATMYIGRVKADPLV